MVLDDERMRRVRLGYEFLRRHAIDGLPFSIDDVMRATEWTRSSVQTYISKQWKDYLRRESRGIYVVLPEFRRLTEDNFFELISQNRRVFSAYNRVEFDSIVTYEFLLPLTKENVLRDALDSLFYLDTLQRRLAEIGMDTVHRWVTPQDGEEPETYSTRLCDMIARKFGGYSISHVDGRFRAAGLTTRASAGAMLADDRKYLVDETTAVVRFIIPLQSARHEAEGPFTFDVMDEDNHMRQEVAEVRSFFFNLFAEAVVRVVRGEEEIWLVEETGHNRRLYVWEKVT